MTGADDVKLDTALSWTANLIAITVLPTSLGLSGQPLWAFLAYAIVSGAVLTFVEDRRYLRTIWVRPDVGDYLQVRIALAAMCGIWGYLVGSIAAIG